MVTDGILCEVRAENVETLDNPNIILEKDRFYTVSPLKRYLDIYEVLIIINRKNLLHLEESHCGLCKARKITRIASVLLENIQEFKI
jgi:hypothetical protein